MNSLASTIERPQALPRLKGRALGETLNFAELDALTLAIFSDKQLSRSVRTAAKVDLSAVRTAIQKVVARHAIAIPTPTSQHMEMHDQLMAGFSGEAVIISSAFVLNTLAEAERSFHMSFKTIKSKLGQPLEPAPSELALRMVRAGLAASRVFGDVDAARKYLSTRNFALGGATPIDLLQTAAGERIVLNELQTQADGGPL